MLEILEPIFGETGALVAMFVITLVIILLLIVLVLWLVRRFGMGGVGTSARGRLPRLAIVDALPVDNRRRLVLVRRDNVEHLVLIGGTNDLVIEPSIIRTRVAQKPGQPPQPRPPGQAIVAPTPTPPPAIPSPPAPPAAATRRTEAPIPAPEEPIPFPPPQRRPAQAASRPPRAAARPEAARPAERPAAAAAVEAEPPFRPRIIAEMEARAAGEIDAAMAEIAAPTAHFAETSRPTRINPGPLFQDEPAAATADPVEDAESPLRPARTAATGPTIEAESFETAAEVEMAESAAPAIAGDLPASDEVAEEGPRVSDLEKEMARLLGEISSRRQS